MHKLLESEYMKMECPYCNSVMNMDYGCTECCMNFEEVKGRVDRTHNDDNIDIGQDKKNIKHEISFGQNDCPLY